MININDITAEIEQLCGHKLNQDEGLLYGSPQKINKVTVCWMATPSAIAFAGQAGHDLIICHESLFFPYGVVDALDEPEGWQNWKINEQRKALLKKYNLSCLRIHGSADEICVYDEFAKALGLDKPAYRDGLIQIFDITPCRLEDLVKRVKEKVGMQSVRVADVAGLQQKVAKVGLPWGGLGLFVNVDYQQALVKQGCDVFIAGESDNYGFRFAQENGIPMIETSHELSENPGLKKFTQMLSETFPKTEFRFYENDCVWKIV